MRPDTATDEAEILSAIVSSLAQNIGLPRVIVSVEKFAKLYSSPDPASFLYAEKPFAWEKA